MQQFVYCRIEIFKNKIFVEDCHFVLYMIQLSYILQYGEWNEMKINDGFTLKQVADSYVIVPTGDNIVDFSAMITINETGAFLWNKLSESTDTASLANALCEEYEVSYDEALADAREFVEILKSKKVLS